MNEAYFERVDERRFRPTAHTGGGWDPTELHFSPLGGLIVHAIERHRAGSPENGMLLGRISFDILGRLSSDECEIVVTTARGGRTIELVDAIVRIAGRDVARAHAWYLTETDTTSVAGGGPDPLAEPDTLARWQMSSMWPGGFVASLEVRPVRPLQPGRATAWVTTAVDLVAGEVASPLASYVALIDIANGLGARERPDEWMFPNMDLTIHLHRQPGGHWVGLDTTTTFGPSGQGVTSTVLHDVAGPVGFANQVLTVRPGRRPPRP
ncbi:thioesterase family protein [Agromyces sp. SYSU K20354]|uniref:thioesterase family protein n=1 Tax=Agromyces cavernae TaxID=2898659 RepID=UPI001E431B8F|nr:thioesterase family protein [Agromyces cavernae]MCD2442766.1 thioesterase family protein [Agromyces cavernae]